jgi:hypothetical protein
MKTTVRSRDRKPQPSKVRDRECDTEHNGTCTPWLPQVQPHRVAYSETHHQPWKQLLAENT